MSGPSKPKPMARAHRERREAIAREVLAVIVDRRAGREGFSFYPADAARDAVAVADALLDRLEPETGK